MKTFLVAPAFIGLSLLAFTGIATAQSCSEGCTPGYWKNHPERWDGVGGDDFTFSIQHQLSFNAVLGVTEAESGIADSVTLLEAAGTGGGGLTALNRHTAAATASSDTSIFYPFALAEAISLYQDAVGVRIGAATVDSAHAIFESANELGCPLSNSWEPTGVCTYCFAEDAVCPCGVSYPGGGCPNSTSVGAILSATGSGSVDADDLVLTVTQLPPKTPVIWIMAPEVNGEVLRDGLLCVAPGHLKIFRFPASLSSAQGVSVLGAGIVQASVDHPVAAAEITAGDTRNFQCFYRDLDSPCGGDANTSNAAHVEFY
ncbi:MAG: hypothetical protein ACI8X5_003364 [Planctomycetota bacterium]|jgi:hypothetical protein